MIRRLKININVNNTKKVNEVRFEDDETCTMSKSRYMFSKRHQLKADQVIRLQHVAAFLAKITLLCSFGINCIKNNPMTPEDAEISENMLGLIKCLSEGKTTMNSPKLVDSGRKMIEVPPKIKILYDDVQLAAGVLHVNGVNFLTSMSNYIHSGTANAINNMKAATLKVGLKNIIKC